MTGKPLKGQSVLELVIATGVFFMVVTSVIGLIFGGRSLVVDTRQALPATDYALEGLDAVRLIRDQSWSNLVDGTYGLSKSSGDWQFSGASDIQDQYTRRVTISSLSANSKRVQSEVSWIAPPARSQVIRQSTILTNWVVTQQDNNVSGDWQHPGTAGVADVDSGAQGTDVLVENGIIFLSSSASLLSKPDLTIFSVADPYAPATLSSVDLGISNATAITKSGNYLYMAVAGAADEFIVVDVSNTAAPVKVKSVDLSSGRSYSLKAVGNRLYVGMERLTGESEFYVADITDPLNPVYLGAFEVDANVSAMTIFNNKAYIATSHDAGELMVLDITDPAAITKLGQYDVSGTVDGSAITVKDEYNVHLGLESSSGPEFYMFNTIDPTNITVLGTAQLPAKINDMVAINHLVFLMTEQASAEFRILDITNPSNIVTNYATMNFPQVGMGIDFENNTIYCSVRSNSALRIIKSG